MASGIQTDRIINATAYLFVQLVVVGGFHGLKGAAMVGKLQEGVALGLSILGQRVVLVDNLAKLEEIQ